MRPAGAERTDRAGHPAGAWQLARALSDAKPHPERFEWRFEPAVDRNLETLRSLVGRRLESDPLAFDRRAALPLGDGTIPWSVLTVKRALDIVVSAAALLLSLPVLLLVAAAVKATSRGPVLYRQERVCPGPNGEPATFEMIKFRTMRVDAESKSGPVWASARDPRVTPIGRFLRTHRLDELPQLWQVLRGQMTLVGPRPERPALAKDLAAKLPAYTRRLRVPKLGITGWAQVELGYDQEGDLVRSREKLAFDLAYVAGLHRLSTYLRLEAWILWKTIRVVLTGKGAR